MKLNENFLGLTDEDMYALVQDFFNKMGTRRIKIQRPGEPDDLKWLEEKNLFKISEIQSKQMMDLLDTIEQDTSSETQDKLDFLLSIKKNEWATSELPELSDLLRKSFYVDGAIKISGEELNELAEFFGNQKQRIITYENPLEIISSELAYKKGENMIFRGPKYYFLFDGLNIDMNSRTSSINDYEILGLNFDKFISETVKHYNIINKSIDSVSYFFMDCFLLNIKDNKDSFCKELLNKLAIKKIKSLRRKADSEKNLIGHKNTDDFFKQQWDYVLDELNEFRKLVHNYRKDNLEKDLELIVFFLVANSSLILQARVLFGLNIDDIINKYIIISPSRAHRKLILGLLDARINILSFMQNLSQIIYSDDFLNADFTGSLVFKQDVVKNIKKFSNEKFLKFKDNQKKIKERDRNISILAELEYNTALFMDVLLNDNRIAYVRLAGSEFYDNIISEDSHMPHELKDIIDLSTGFFELLDSYFMSFENKEKNREKKNSAHGKRFKKSEVHTIAKRDAWKKLIRIYREENDPLAMILTAQNAMSLIQKKGYSPKKDVLHIMSVNYGGALVGLYAKHTFSRAILDGQLITNNGSLVYSIYDVKNANSFFKLSDYPFSSIAKDHTLDADTRKKLKQENWLLIFDDNTNSGETLDNIKQLAFESDFYGRIDAFTCRANTDIKKYKESLTMQQRLDIIGVSGLIARKARIISYKDRYKEIIGTIVGSNLFKIINKKS